MKVKKILMSLICCIALVLSTIAVVQAKESDYYVEIKIEILEESLTRATSTKTAKKTASVKNSSGQVLWSVSVIGTFTYNGTSSTCTKSTVEAVSNDKNWTITNKSSSKTGNKATAKATATMTLPTGTVGSKDLSVTLTCDAKGNCY